MGNPTVSVITPAYNGADHLGEAIQSVLDQTYPHSELIVVDDASTDETPEIVRRFDDPRLKYIVHKENRGPDVARHTPVFPLARENASAMCAAACSCRTSTCVMLFC